MEDREDSTGWEECANPNQWPEGRVRFSAYSPSNLVAKIEEIGEEHEAVEAEEVKDSEIQEGRMEGREAEDEGDLLPRCQRLKEVSSKPKMKGWKYSTSKGAQVYLSLVTSFRCKHFR